MNSVSSLSHSSLSNTTASTNNNEHLYKIVLLGESGTGKSSIVERFVRDHFLGYKQPTIGASFLTQTVQLDNHTIIKYQIWDTAGQERYRSLAPMYYRGSSAAIVVYDITSHDSFIGAQSWIDEVRKQGSSDTIIGLTGNKLDLNQQRQVEISLAEKYCAENNISVFLETSAKTGENVKELFKEIAKKLPLDAKKTDVISFEDSDEKPTSSCCSRQ